MSKIMWQPQNPQNSQMWQFMQFTNSVNNSSSFNYPNEYQKFHQWSIAEPAAFWQSLCDYLKFTFIKPPQEILTPAATLWQTKWFRGAEFNFTAKLLARRDNHIALTSINEKGEKHHLGYFDLCQAVAKCAAALKAAGVKPGTRVAAVLPNVHYTVIAMLATAALGAIWSSCSSDFGAAAIMDRFSQINPTILFIGDGHQYGGKIYHATAKIQEILQNLPSLTKIIICPIINIDLNFPTLTYWDDFINTTAYWDWAAFPFDHPLYIMFSSGTTGRPKCIMHGAGGTLIQHLKELAIHTDLRPKDNLLFYTTCGWMMWNWMISTLALGATLTLYEGSPTYPGIDSLWQIISEEKITVFGTSAKYLSTIEKLNLKPQKKFSLPFLRTILATGSPLLPFNYDFVYQNIKTDVQLSSISGGTDIISCFALGNPVLPVYRGELQCLGLGMAVKIFNKQGKALIGHRGELVCTKPFPSMPLGFWQDPEDEKYKKTYFNSFKNVWTHGDFATITKHGGLIIYGRSDTVLNPGGVRIGTAEIYRQLETLPMIRNSVVIGQDWQKDVRIVLFVQLQENLKLNSELEQMIKDTIKLNTSPRHVPAKILQVTDIPMTQNGKISELAVKQIVHHEQVTNFTALANPEVLAEFANRVELN